MGWYGSPVAGLVLLTARNVCIHHRDTTARNLAHTHERETDSLDARSKLTVGVCISVFTHTLCLPSPDRGLGDGTPGRGQFLLSIQGIRIYPRGIISAAQSPRLALSWRGAVAPWRVLTCGAWPGARALSLCWHTVCWEYPEWSQLALSHTEAVFP